MRIFEHFSKGAHMCPICGTDNDEETILISIEGTKDGNNVQALQAHTKCLHNALQYTRSFGGVIIAEANHPYYREPVYDEQDDEHIHELGGEG